MARDPDTAPAFCPFCGAPLTVAGQRFCAACGRDLPTSTPVANELSWGIVAPPAPSRQPIIVSLAAAGLAVVIAAVAALGVMLAGGERGGSGAASPTASATATIWPASPSPSPTEAYPDRVHLRWFVGLGAGSQPNGTTTQQDFVRAFNSIQDEVFLELEIVPNTNAYDVLKSEIAEGNPPDIIGPVGVAGRHGFAGLFADVAPLIDRYGVDTSAYEPALFDLLTDGDVQIGLPYTMYPGFIFYNKDVFEAANLPDLPRRVGDKYQGKTWDWNALGGIAAQLTKDDADRTSTQSGFDADNIAQWGIDFQWADSRRIASCFGTGSFVAADGKTAQIPGVWREAWKWYYDAMWKHHYAPTGPEINSSLLNSGLTVASGRIAMDAAWPWAINSFGYQGATFAKWDMAVMPSWKGQTSSPLDIDTFAISAATAHPDEAFTTMLAIEADPSLMYTYGGMPARTADQADYFAVLDADQASSFPGNQVSWSVLQEMARYPVVPSHEAYVPNYAKARDDSNEFLNLLQTTEGLNVDDALADLKATLQADFDSASY